MTEKQPKNEIRDYSSINNTSSTLTPAESEVPAPEDNALNTEQQEEQQIMGFLRRWYSCYLKRSHHSNEPNNEGSESDALLPRPVPDRGNSEEDTGSWWDLLPAPAKDFIYKNRWWFLVAIILFIIIVLILLIYTGNYAYIPFFLRLMMCSFFSDYFDQLCHTDGMNCSKYAFEQ